MEHKNNMPDNGTLVGFKSNQISNRTKSLKTQKRILSLISLLLNILPLVWFLVSGFINGDSKQKLTIGLISSAAIVLTVLMQLFKFKLKRTLFWLVLLGIFICYAKLGTCLIVIGICSIIDEVIIEPILERVKYDYRTNREIDKRQ